MGVMSERLDNPFRITKSNDLTDEQIDQLWVPSGEDEDAFVRPTSPMAMFILGGKGSGKSHLMRYYSFPLQLIRYRRIGGSLIENLRKDGYLGIYARCGGLNAHRFRGKGQSDDVWDSLFAYYFELWVADRLLGAIEILAYSGALDGDVQSAIAGDISRLFDSRIEAFQSISAARQYLTDLRQALDYSINNAALTNRLETAILFSRGQLFFGVPSIVCSRVDALQRLLVVYLLDEFENFTVAQQIYVNTLISEREVPTAFKIGSRLYGFRTQETLSGGERNLEGSEYEKLELDERFRKNSEAYRTFALKLVARRLSATFGPVQPTDPSLEDLSSNFEEPDLNWNSKLLTDLFRSNRTRGRPHLNSLKEKLRVSTPREDLHTRDFSEMVSFGRRVGSGSAGP
jgi:hypothetical protein